ncbi:hypothetical protein TTHERM_00443109 (macronuclear) [Tetrahymena thermophila SB210]|uniref:Uncharacterized protein n=1 Tax=Tetrahymena thermophila (strain SB210) TaxID=312017 RepID=A4VEZ3_TETTS|nr:hypothetical protein TTHERM_00443109 [Tetrahymena thermophila SB210]EDK31280.1 hypothetical protein TTHERM_00443109 [Tetrahymena thermophila SB210]|eukprot:XP_001470696.1 hypothetical protein TTHERM_00443109 [Tetrahymena thermophila SB210]
MKKVFKSKAYKDKLKGHKDGVIKIYSPYGPDSGLLLSASKDGCIRAWDLIERKITVKLLLSRDGNDTSQMAYQKDDDQQSGDDDDVNRDEENVQQQKNKDSKKTIDQFTAACFSENSVYGGYEDGLICSWNIKEGSLNSLYKGHSEAITELEFLNTRLLISASLDQTIRVWDTMNGMNETIYHLNGPVNLMRINKKYIQAITNKNTFVEINSDNSKVTKSVHFTSTSVTSFITYENQLIIATINNIMEVYDLDSLDQENVQPNYIIENNKDWILCMKILDNYLYTGGDDRRIKVWDLSTKLTLVEDFIGHEDGVVCIDFADNMLYSGSFDHSIRSWNLKEMENRIRERAQMFKEDIWSRKYDAWYKVFYKKKKKGKKGSKSKK